MNNLQNTKHPVFFIGILKTMLIIVETASYDFGENMYSLIRCLFCGIINLYLYLHYFEKLLIVILKGSVCSYLIRDKI